MQRNYLEIIMFECSKYLTKDQYNKIFNLLTNFENVTDFLDYINIEIYKLHIGGEITKICYHNLLATLDKHYNRGINYSINRIDWINELKKHDKEMQLSEHHKMLLDYFSLINKILHDNDIDYFHASGFMCYLLVGRVLERYHHDIDLYVNIEDIDKIKTIFNNDKLQLIHTCEKNNKDVFRHGYKIENSIYDIPIWLSFYKRLTNGTIYMQEYYQNINGTYYTKENYNSPLCCELSLVKHYYNGTPFNSLSLEALYVSKNGNRKKDVFDCKIIEKFVNKNQIKILENELCSTWDKVEGLPKEMKKAFFGLEMEERNDGKTLTKKRI